MNCTPKVRQYGKLFREGVRFFMATGKTSKRYTGEFKQKAVETMRAEKLSYCEASRLFGTTDKSICAWERIILRKDRKACI
jgi:transposase-like protein